MIDFDAAGTVVQDRSDFTAMSCVPIALPYWRLRVRVEVLARRPISPLEEFVMRASQDADPGLGQVQSLLGLDDRTFHGTVDAVVGREWARVEPGDRLRLTPKGVEVTSTAVRERGESRVISIDYDGLLRRPMLLDLPIEPQQRRRIGLRELPARPVTAPDVLELQETFADLERIIRRGGDGRDQEVDLLAIKGILRKERIYREGTLVVLRSREGKVQAAPIIEGVLSDEHEQALAHPDVLRVLRLPSELRRGRKYDSLLPTSLRAAYDADADHEARQLRSDARAQLLEGEATAEQTADAARYATRALPIRELLPHEHPRLLRTVLKTATTRATIATPRATGIVIERELLRDLEGALGRGVMVSILLSDEGISDAPELLKKLAEQHEQLAVRAGGDGSVSTLIRDDDLAARSLFPLLAYYGRERPFRDERGWLVQRTENVAAVTSDLHGAMGIGDQALGGRRSSAASA